jgi:hypothetical protein
VDPRPAPHEDGDAAHLTIKVEAVGSGKVILPALQVNWDTTVAALKARIQGRRVPVSLGGIRLFAGHGGKELADDLQSVRAAGVARGATLALMVVSDQVTLSRLFEATRGGQWRHRKGWGPLRCLPGKEWAATEAAASSPSSSEATAYKVRAGRLEHLFGPRRARTQAAC